MTTEAAIPLRPSLFTRLMAGRAGPVAVVSLAIVVLWYLGAVYMNAPVQIDRYERGKVEWTFGQLVADTLEQDRPVLPAPHQILVEMDKTILGKKITSRRSLVYHAWITLSSALAGFLTGAVLGIVLAVGIVHKRTLDKSLMPWIIASQTIPILAIAPMVVVVLGTIQPITEFNDQVIGNSGFVQKALVSTYLCFFPVTIGMVKGFRSPDILSLDLMRTYSASRWQTFRMLRWPAALPFLFTSLKISIAASMVGAIVAELPTGAQAGLGARMLQGSYHGQMINIWSALLTAALISGMLVALVGVFEKFTTRLMGGRP